MFCVWCIYRNLAMVMSEMIQTERDYVKSLQFVIDNYLPEMLRDDVPQALRGKRNVVFGNLEQIHQFHSQYFLKALERCENSPLHVARIFLKHVSFNMRNPVNLFLSKKRLVQFISDLKRMGTFVYPWSNRQEVLSAWKLFSFLVIIDWHCTIN